jgi:hypothetical protein
MPKSAEINYCAYSNKAILRMLDRDRLQGRIHLQCTMARGVCALRALVLLIHRHYNVISETKI